MSEAVIVSGFVTFFVLGMGYGIFMWYQIITAICSAKQYDPALYERWGSPRASGFLFNVRDQRKILLASFDISLQSPKSLTLDPLLQRRFGYVQKIIDWWNGGIVLIGITVLMVALIIKIMRRQ